MNESGSEPGDDSGELQTLAIALELVEELQRTNGATVTELQQRLDLSKSAIYNHLNTLREYEFVVKDGDRFELGLVLTLLGEYVREQNDLYAVGKDPIGELAETVGYTTHLVTEQHYNRIEICIERGEEAVGRKFSSVYDPLYFHTTASGKAILAFVDDETQDAILEKHGLPGRTPNTIDDRATLREELEVVRKRGYAINTEEEIEGLLGIAAPILGTGNSVEGAVSISAPVGRIPEERLHEGLAEKVTQTANVIQLDLNMAKRTHT
jgi:DNA-binding IclR family transcriptional regulator